MERAEKMRQMQPDNDWHTEAEEYYEWLIVMNLLREDDDRAATKAEPSLRRSTS